MQTWIFLWIPVQSVVSHPSEALPSLPQS